MPKYSKFRVDTSQLEGMDTQAETGLRRGMILGTAMLVAITKEEAPQKTGNFRKYIVPEITENGTKLKGEAKCVARTGATSSGKTYNLGELIAFGTGEKGPKHKPFAVIAKKKKSLNFEYQGKNVFAKRAMVKGMKPNPFHERALVRAEPRLPDEIEKGLSNL